jgi:AhpD family alkylhydroperoxidase
MFEEPRFDTTKLAPEPMKLFRELHSVLSKQLEPRLFHLLQHRASQIKGCAYCMYMHSHDALAAGESPQRLFVLEAWHESPLFTDKGRAALAWVEAIKKTPRPMRRPQPQGPPLTSWKVPRDRLVIHSCGARTVLPERSSKRSPSRSK